MQQNNEVPVILAVYSAVVATIVAIVQIANFLRRRPSLKVSGYKINIANGKSNNEGKVHIVAHNSGRRAVTVLNAGIYFGKKPSMATDTIKGGASGPVYLPDNKAISYEIPYDTVAVHQKQHNQTVTGVFCEIAGGKVYKSKFQLKTS